MLVGVKPRTASQDAQTCHACNLTYRQVRSQELSKMLPRELSLPICRSDLSSCLLWAHCTVYFQSDVMGSQDSAGLMNYCRGEKTPFVLLHKWTSGLSVGLLIKEFSSKKPILSTQHPQMCLLYPPPFAPKPQLQHPLSSPNVCLPLVCVSPQTQKSDMAV